MQLPQLFGRPRRIGLGDAGIVWTPIDLSSGSFTFQPLGAYAVLASVGSGTSIASITSYLSGKGFQISYICEPGSNCSRSQYGIDQWLAGMTAKPRSGERWVYAEGSFAGQSAWTVDVTDSFPKTLVVTYSISNAFSGTAPPAPPPSPSTDPGATPTPTPTTIDPSTSQPSGDFPVVTTPPGSGSTSKNVAGVAVAGSVVGLAAVLWWLSRRRKR